MQIREVGAGTIVVRLPNWVGDAVMATPALRALRRALPDSRMLAVGTPPVCRLLAGVEGVDEFVELSRSEGSAGQRRLAGEIRARGPDLTLLLPHSFSSALLAVRWGGRRVGFSSLERALLLHHRVPRTGGRRTPGPMTRHYLDLLSHLGVVSDDERMLLAISEEEYERAERHLEELSVSPEEPFFAVNPGASFGASKCWTVKGFSEVVRKLGERARTLILCGPGEEQWAEEISSRCGEFAVDTSRRVLPLELLKPVLERARLLITTDTGPRHIAAAVGTPQVSLLGPTDARYSGTNLERTRVLQVEVECGPCHLKICPLDHRCMVRLTSDRVMAAIEDLLETGRPAQGVSSCQN